MRVIVTNEDSEAARIAGSGENGLSSDLELAAPEKTEAFPPVLNSFLSSLDLDEAPYSVVGCKVWAARVDAKLEPAIFASQLDLTAPRYGREQYEGLASGLAKLLERESGDALWVKLHVMSSQAPEGLGGLCLRTSLFACAATREQAQLRWSLGFARLQQALLFEARAIRRDRH